MKLPKAIIRKYGISKKAWSMVKSHSRKKTGGTMAKRHYKKHYSAPQKKGLFSGDIGQAIGAAGYGALRAKISQMIAPMTSKIPAGQYADNIGMLLATWIGKKYLPAQVRPVAKAGFLIESAMLGAELAQNIPALNGGASQNSTTVGNYNF